jgi:hypothetical protein
MASFAISGDGEQTKREISYDYIEVEDSDAVLDLLKRTFFKVSRELRVKWTTTVDSRGTVKFWLRKERKETFSIRFSPFPHHSHRQRDLRATFNPIGSRISSISVAAAGQKVSRAHAVLTFSYFIH